jgi:hypothetical protein
MRVRIALLLLRPSPRAPPARARPFPDTGSPRWADDGPGVHRLPRPQGPDPHARPLPRRQRQRTRAAVDHRGHGRASRGDLGRDGRPRALRRLVAQRPRSGLAWCAASRLARRRLAGRRDRILRATGRHVRSGSNDARGAGLHRLAVREVAGHRRPRTVGRPLLLRDLRDERVAEGMASCSSGELQPTGKPISQSLQSGFVLPPSTWLRDTPPCANGFLRCPVSSATGVGQKKDSCS